MKTRLGVVMLLVLCATSIGQEKPADPLADKIVLIVLRENGGVAYLVKAHVEAIGQDRFMVGTEYDPRSEKDAPDVSVWVPMTQIERMVVFKDRVALRNHNDRR